MLPVLFEGQVKAVIELASVGVFTDLQISFLEQLTAGIGIVLNSIEATMQTEGLLKQSQQLATELQTQQRELQQTNEQLEQKAQQLAERNVEVERKNQEIEQARRALEEKATELALTSKYKSEFLANMSHELRTPLNSILILGQQLADNPDGNLTDKQVEFARTIHRRRHRSAQPDQRHPRPVEDRIRHRLGRGRGDVLHQPAGHGRAAVPPRGGKPRPLLRRADRPRLDRSIVTDSKRLQQVLKNLLSNAFKFTEHGGVRLIDRRRRRRLERRPSDAAATRRRWSPSRCPTPASASRRRSRRSSSRRSSRPTPAPAANIGGTGLGLAISRELAHLLGGEIQLRSAPGVGSTFTLYLPLRYMPAAPVPQRPASTGATALGCRDQLRARWPSVPVEQLPDDRDNIEPGDTVLLIVEDDPHYARIMVDLAHDSGLKVLVATRGADALALAREYQPTAVSLDVFLPDMLGWTVLSQLKQNPATRHIPVQIVTLDEDRQHGLARGAFSFITKPTTTEGLEQALDQDQGLHHSRGASGCWWSRTMPPSSCSITELLGHDDIDIMSVETGGEALEIAARAAGRLRRARSAAAGHVGLRAAGADPRRRRPLRRCRSSSSPAASSRRRRMRSSTPWRAASW